jgi:hypothetical protein
MTMHEPVVELRSPSAFSKDDYDCFREMVLEAGEIEEAGLDARLGRAKALAFLRLGVKRSAKTLRT